MQFKSLIKLASSDQIFDLSAFDSDYQTVLEKALATHVLKCEVIKLIQKHSIQYSDSN